MIHSSAPGFSDPLNICSNGQAVFWADYGNNPDRKVVNIYRFDESWTVEIVYSFPAGTVRHVHNLIWSSEANAFYILTGDLEEKSGIYLATHDWSEVHPVVIGRQQYRAVAAFPFKNGLIYATDSVEEDNRIYLLLDGSLKPLTLFPGSCIYGAETKEYYVFSSTVEPPEGRGIWDLFTYKLGPGIKDHYAHLITVRKSDLQVRDVLKVKKDIWPMKLFQYGTIMFPNGQEMNDKVWYYIVACKGDGKTKELHLQTDLGEIM